MMISISFIIYNTWFLIVNPSAGNTNFKKSWNKIQYLLKSKKFIFLMLLLSIPNMKLVLAR